MMFLFKNTLFSSPLLEFYFIFKCHSHKNMSMMICCWNDKIRKKGNKIKIIKKATSASLFLIFFCPEMAPALEIITCQTMTGIFYLSLPVIVYFLFLLKFSSDKFINDGCFGLSFHRINHYITNNCFCFYFVLFFSIFMC